MMLQRALVEDVGQLPILGWQGVQWISGVTFPDRLSSLFEVLVISQRRHLRVKILMMHVVLPGRSYILWLRLVGQVPPVAIATDGVDLPLSLDGVIFPVVPQFVLLPQDKFPRLVLLLHLQRYFVQISVREMVFRGRRHAFLRPLLNRTIAIGEDVAILLVDQFTVGQHNERVQLAVAITMVLDQPHSVDVLPFDVLSVEAHMSHRLLLRLSLVLLDASLLEILVLVTVDVLFLVHLEVLFTLRLFVLFLTLQFDDLFLHDVLHH